MRKAMRERAKDANGNYAIHCSKITYSSSNQKIQEWAHRSWSACMCASPTSAHSLSTRADHNLIRFRTPNFFVIIDFCLPACAERCGTGAVHVGHWRGVDGCDCGWSRLVFDYGHQDPSAKSTWSKGSGGGWRLRTRAPTGVEVRLGEANAPETSRACAACTYTRHACAPADLPVHLSGTHHQELVAPAPTCKQVQKEWW